jgi:glycosyltransferase involved in cell wall biosynthesis
MHVTDVFTPRLGGIEVQVAGLTAAQRNRGLPVCVLTTTSGGDAEPGSYPVYRTTVVKAARLLAQLRPSVLHVHLSVFSPLGWAAIRWAQRAGVAVVATVHSLWDRPIRIGYRLLAAMGTPAAALVVTAVSDQARDLVANAIPDVRVSTVPNAIATARWSSTPRAPSHSNVHVVAIGRLAPRRRPIELLQILRLADRRLRPPVTLRATIAGAGPLRPMMAAYLRQHGMTDQVRLAGSLKPPDLAGLLSTADVLLNPVRREAFGIATLEARTAGVPIIALRHTGVADFIQHGVEGLLCASTAELVDSLVTLAENVSLRHRITIHNRINTPTQFDWAAVLSQYDQCYARASALLTVDRR